MQPLCRSNDWTVVNHYCTQNWGLTMCILRQCCTHCLCPTLWSQCSKTGSVLAMQPLCKKSWLDCGKSLLHTKLGSQPCVFCGNAALTVPAPHCGHCAPKLARLWPCSPCAEVIVRTVGKSLLHTKLGSNHVYLRQCCTHCLCTTLWPLCPKLARSWPCSFCAEVMIGLW